MRSAPVWKYLTGCARFLATCWARRKLLDYAPERDIDTSFELPDRTPEQALEAYMADAAARMDEAFNALADKPEVQEYISAIYEAELAAADEAITKAQTRAELRQEAAASLMRGQHEQR